MAMWLVLGSLLLCAVFGSVMQSSLYGLAGQISTAGELTVSGEVGKAVCGVSIIIVRILTKAVCSDDLKGQSLSTTCFFAFGFLVVVSAVVAFLHMLGNPIIAERLRVARASAKGGSASEADNTQASEGGHAEAVAMSKTQFLRSVFAKLWPQATTAFLVFFTCLSCFPGLTSSLKSTTLSLGNWFPIVMIAIYNCGDLVGKILPQYYCFFRSGTRARYLPLAGLLHILFVPLFVLRVYYEELGDWYVSRSLKITF